MRNLITTFAAATALVILSGCGSMDTRTQKLNLGMSKDQTTSLLGKDFKAVGAREAADAREVEVIRYDDPKYGELLLYFRDGKLVQWGDIRILDNMPPSEG